MLGTNPHHADLRRLEEFAYDLAAGRARGDFVPTLTALRVGDARGNWLLRILHETSSRLTESAAARRQFFHATRALLTLRRDPIAREVAA